MSNNNNAKLSHAPTSIYSSQKNTAKRPNLGRVFSVNPNTNPSAQPQQQHPVGPPASGIGNHMMIMMPQQHLQPRFPQNGPPPPPQPMLHFLNRPRMFDFANLSGAGPHRPQLHSPQHQNPRNPMMMAPLHHQAQQQSPRMPPLPPPNVMMQQQNFR